MAVAKKKKRTADVGRTPTEANELVTRLRNAAGIKAPSPDVRRKPFKALEVKLHSGDKLPSERLIEERR